MRRNRGRALSLDAIALQSSRAFLRRVSSMAPPLTLKPHLLLLLIITVSSPSHQTEDPVLIDGVVRESAFRYFLVDHPRTAVVYNVSLPPTVAGATAATVRFRMGSLRRHGATLDEFRVAPGVLVHPRSTRIVIVKQNLGVLSSAYGSYRNISGFRLVSPVLGLLFYRAASVRNSSIPPQLQILATKRPITVDFSRFARSSPSPRVLCAHFELDGNLSLSNATSGNVCAARTQGHFALVIEFGSSGDESGGGGEAKLSGWKVVVVSVAGGAFSAVLLGLIAVALVTANRKRLLTAEMERRAYEEEALQVSMVGHVRAPTAAVVRTAPRLERDVAPSWW